MGFRIVWFPCGLPVSDERFKGEGAKMEFTGVTFAGHGQNLDTGAKVVHAAPNTSSYMNTRSISKDGGISTFRSSVVVAKDAKGSKSAVSCQSLMLDSESRSDTIPPWTSVPKTQPWDMRQRSEASATMPSLPDVTRHDGRRCPGTFSQRICRQRIQGTSGRVRG